MKKYCWCSLLLVCFQGLAPGGGALSAGEPSAQDLIQRTPVIKSGTKDYESIEIEGYLKQSGSIFLKFRSTYRAPDRYSLMISDGIDGTPLLLAAERKILFYDPVRPVVLYSEGMNISFTLSQEGDTVGLFWWTDKKKPSEILVDIRSFFTGPAKKDEVLKVTEREYTLIRTSAKDNHLKVYYSITNPVPSRIELVMNRAEEPFLCISKIIVNGTSRDSDFVFPARERLAQQVPVRESWSDDSLLNNLGAAALAMRACYARLAANQPKMRESVESSLPDFLHIDWDRVRENDKKFSRVLRESLSPKSK